MRYLLVLAFAASLAAQEKLVETIEVKVVDNYSLEPQQRNKTLAAMRKFLDANFQPGDEASLFVWSRKAEQITPLTNAKAEILRGIDTTVSRSRTGMSAIEEEGRARQTCSEIINEVDNVHLTWEQAWLNCQGGVRAFT